ncbi:MAG: hypothetical protein C5B51_11815 [Terriglobia bacterium]|nr:MAG: hypothetical protein C5B51_11815 [Terriglobia bacterium]
MRHRNSVFLPLALLSSLAANVSGQTASIDAVVNAADFQAPVAPGSVISIFGSNLARATEQAGGAPVPTTLGGVSVVVNGTLKAPLFYVSPAQINAQLPYEVLAGKNTIVVNGSSPASFTVAASAPGIITYGAGRAVAVNQDYSLNSPEHPAPVDGWMTVYMTGQGLVSPPVVTGTAAPGDPLSVPMLSASATLGGQPATILFAGLTPGYVGLFQVNLRVPSLPSGDFPLVVTVGGTRSNIATVAVSGSGGPALSVVRTMAYHQLTALPDSGPDYRSSTVISGNGATIAYTYAPSSGNHIYTMNFDGSGRREVDSYKSLCYCGPILDLSDDGSKLVSTDQRQIRLVDKGVTTLLTVDTGIMGLKMEGDGRRVFFLIDRDGNILSNGKAVAPIQRGLYVIGADGAGMRQIVGPNAVASLFGSTADAHISPEFTVTGNAPNHSLGVTFDGTRIVFGARKIAGNGPDAIFGVNLDGSNLHLIVGPVPYVGHLAINSAGGAKVLYDTTSKNFVVETGVINFDGTGQLALRHDGLGNTPGVQLSCDGTLLLAFDILYKTDGSGTLQLSTVLNSLTPGSPVMNGAATRFVYSFVVPHTYSQGLTQLASLEINPAALGSAPVIANVTVNPPAIAPGGKAAAVSAQISPAAAVIAANYALVRDGLVEDLVNGDVSLVDDGTGGDPKAGDGVFTCNNVVASSKAPAGPRLLRLFAQVTDAAGLRHGTAVDLTPFAVEAK